MKRIRLKCFDPGEAKPYFDYVNKMFLSETRAYETALSCAEDEVDSLNMGCDEGISFGVVDNYDTEGKIYVMYYYMESEYDTTGNSEIVTVYEVVTYNPFRQFVRKVCGQHE